MEINYLEKITTVSTKNSLQEFIDYVRQLKDSWYWFAVSLLIFFTAAIAYLRYATPRYEVSASVLVRDDSKGTDLGEAALLESLGLSAGKNNVDNEVEILKSRTLMESVVEDLQLHIQYHAEGRIKSGEMYDMSPVQLTFSDQEHNLPSTRESTYVLRFKNQNEFALSNPAHTWNQSFGDTFLLPQGRAVMKRTWNKPAPDKKYTIKIMSKELLVTRYGQTLSVSAANKLVSIIDLKLIELLPLKGEAILKKLIVNYLEASVRDKNRIADSTIAFIDDNLKLVSEELTGIEKQIERFRITNHASDIGEQTKLLLNNTSQTEKEKLTNESQLKLAEALLSFVTDHPSAIVPTSMVMQTPDFVSLLDKYNNLQIARDRGMVNWTKDHPGIQNLDAQLEGMKRDLVDHIASKKRELQLNTQQLNLYSKRNQTNLDYLPAKERIFLDYARKQEIKQELYVFLLKKRVETSISKSSALANGRIIDLPKANGIPISPKPQLTFILAVLLGLSFPLTFFYLQELFNTRVSGKSEVVAQVNVPFLGEIGHNTQKNIHAVHYQKRGYLPEQFRALRTSLHYLSEIQNATSILITSSMGGEGKTFIALNLSVTLQLAGKKIILIEMDLRKPKLAEYLNLRGKGLSDYVHSNLAIEELIQPSRILDHFDVITSGAIPANPAELILDVKIKKLLTTLRKNYDYIIFDTAPIGLVTDARLLSQYADISLYVIRQKFTFRHQLEAIGDISKNDLLPKLHLILNDVKAKPGYGYTYEYTNH